MAENEQLLTQEQVDAMLDSASEKRFAPAEAPAEFPVSVSATSMEEIRGREPAPTSPTSTIPAPPPTQPEAVPSAGAIQDTVTQLTERLNQLEAAMQQTGQMQQQFQALADQLETINDRVETLMNSLQSTVGFAAHQSFVCDSCQSQGNVATRLNCTACGEEKWWGWWPPKQR